MSVGAITSQVMDPRIIRSAPVPAPLWHEHAVARSQSWCLRIEGLNRADAPVEKNERVASQVTS